jgi:hypothetical protein
MKVKARVAMDTRQDKNEDAYRNYDYGGVTVICIVLETQYAM